MNGPVEIDCTMSSPGLGVRYRDFKNTRGQGDIYLGIGDLGAGGQGRTQADYTWSDPGLGRYNFSFTYETGNDRLRQQLANVNTGTTPNPNPLYYPSSSGGLLSKLTDKGIDITTLNAFRIIVKNKENLTKVELLNLQLITPNGTYDLGDFKPSMQEEFIFEYAWPTDNSMPSDGFTFQGMITLDGDFPNGSGSEQTKIEISIIDCQSINPPICLAAGSQVSLANGQTLDIERLEAGNLVVDLHNDIIPVSHCVRTGKTKSFVLISKDALGPNKPDQDLLIVPGHPILIEGREVDCFNLCNGHSIIMRNFESDIDIYTISTERRTFVNIHGLLVGTWGQDALYNFTANDSVGRRYASSWKDCL